LIGNALTAWRINKGIYKHSGLCGLIGAILLVYTGKGSRISAFFFLFEKFNWALSSVGTLAIFIGVMLVAIQVA